MPGSVSIRPAQPADSAAVQACVVAAYEPYVPLMDKVPAPMLDDYDQLISDSFVYVAENAGTMVGAIVLWPEVDHMYIDNIAVAPEAQTHGVGTALLAFAEAEASRLGLEEIRLYTNEVMVSNVEFYRRRGFVETDRALHEGHRRIFFTHRIEPNVEESPT